jgi:hypothetical protein
MYFKGFTLVAAGAFAILSLVSLPAVAQDQKAAPSKSKPTPRLADGHPDLGNGKGVWLPVIIDDISGYGGGEKDAKTRERQTKMVDAKVDVPFLPWAKKTLR